MPAVSITVIVAWATWSLYREGEEALEALQLAERDRLAIAVHHAGAGPGD